jgi:hypothetical protein
MYFLHVKTTHTHLLVDHVRADAVMDTVDCGGELVGHVGLWCKVDLVHEVYVVIVSVAYRLHVRRRQIVNSCCKTAIDVSNVLQLAKHSHLMA